MVAMTKGLSMVDLPSTSNLNAVAGFVELFKVTNYLAPACELTVLAGNEPENFFRAGM